MADGYGRQQHASRLRASRAAARGPPPARAPCRRAPFGGVVWIVVLAVFLAGVVAVNVAVLQLNVRLDGLGRERVQLRADTRGSAPSSRAPRRRRGSSRWRARGSARARRSPSTTVYVAAGGAAEVTARHVRPPHPPPPLPLRARLRGHAGAGGLAPGRAGVDARADGVAPAARDDGDPRRPRHDLRPDGRAARDRRADDDRLRRPARGARIRARPRSRPRRRSALDANTLYPLLADRARHFVYVQRKADPAKAAQLERRGLPGLGFYPGGAALLPAEERRGARARLRGRRQQRARRARALARPLARGQPGSQTIVKRSRSGAPST